MNSKGATVTPRVLMLTQYLGVGGLERMILSLCISLRQQGSFSPHVFAYDHSPNSFYQSLIEDFRANGIPLEYMKKSPGFSFVAIFRLIRYILRNRIQIIHSHNIGSLIYGSITKLLLLGRVRLFHTQHSFIHLKEKKRYAYYEKFFTLFADQLTVVSEDTRETYEELGYPGKWIELIENGVDFLECPVLDRQQRERFRAELISSLGQSSVAEVLEGGKNDFWVLYLARLHPEKGQDHAMQLWTLLDPEIRKRMRLIFVGPESVTGQVEKLQGLMAAAPDRERLLYAGGTRDPHAWMRAGDLFLFCSEFEGLPLGPLEAIGSGMPAVLSRIPGHDNFSEVSELFPLSDPADGARKLEKLYSEINADYAGACARFWKSSRWIAERFSIAAMTARYSALYRRVLGL